VNRTRAVRFLTHWRTWWDLASVTFVGWFSVVLLGGPTPPWLGPVFSFGLWLSVGLFFVGFACLVRRQRGDDAPSNADQWLSNPRAPYVRTVMGNTDLRQLAVLREVPFEELDGDTVAVDAHNWLYKYLTTTVKWTRDEAYTTADGTEVANLIGVVQGLPKFFENDLTPVFVFDGVVTDLKSEEIEQRREEREKREEQLEEAREEGDAIEVARLEAHTQRLTDTIQQTTRELFDRLDVPYIEAPAEGEAQAAYMNRTGAVDYCGTEDYDALPLGAPLTLRQLTSKGDPELMDFEATLEEHDVTWEQLVDIAILCGTDFNEGVSGIGPKTALKGVTEHGDIWGVLEERGASIGKDVDVIRELFLNPTVSDDYEFDAEMDPDLDAAREYVVGEWNVHAEEVERGFERIEESVVQTGLDKWT
jgi:flap endonuclease-1